MPFSTNIPINYMRIGVVVGCITLSHCHSSLYGARWKLVVPVSREHLVATEDFTNDTSESVSNPPSVFRTEPLVVYDEWNVGEGEWIAISEGVEAAMPFHPDVKPIDAYNAAILDTVDVFHIPKR